MEPLISIISPVYNTEKYINKCITSVLNQTYANFELIMVVDASPDGSLALIKDFAEVDNRIKILVNQRNCGLSKSRFNGLKIANGEFISHLDSDDWLPKNALKVLVDKMITEDADIVYGNSYRVLDKYGLIKYKMASAYTEPLIYPDLFDDYYISYFGFNKLPVNMWGKIYRKSIIDSANINPTDMAMGEDLLYNMALHPYLKKVAFVTDITYFYRYGGMTNKANPSFLEDIKKQYSIKKDNIKKYNYEKANPFIKWELVNCFFSYFLARKRFDKLNDCQLQEIISKEIGDPIYSDLIGFDHAQSHLIVTNNVAEIKNVIISKYKKERLGYNIKKILNFLLN